MQNEIGTELENDNIEKPAEPNLVLEAQIDPLHDFVFCRLDDKQEITEGGIIIPDSAQGKRQEATVVGVGPGRMTDQGVLIPLTVDVGDRVMLPKWGGTEEKIQGIEYSVVRETDILTRIKTVEVNEAGEVVEDGEG